MSACKEIIFALNRNANGIKFENLRINLKKLDLFHSIFQEMSKGVEVGVKGGSSETKKSSEVSVQGKQQTGKRSAENGTW